jgi:hypothetical protein
MHRNLILKVFGRLYASFEPSTSYRGGLSAKRPDSITTISA